MAVIIKDKYKENISPSFNDYKLKLNAIKDRLILMIFLVFLIFMIITVYILTIKLYIKLNLFILLMTIICFRSIDKDINEILDFTSYQEFFESKQDRKLKEKGDKGENNFIEYVIEKLKNNNYKMLNNIYVPGSGPWPQQIDSIIIGPSGAVYIIEIKNWYGLISGQIEDQSWYTHNGHRENPYKQNERHLFNLKNELEHIIPDGINAYNLLINMDRNSYLNLCKFDKDSKNIYHDPQSLLFDVVKFEDQYQVTNTDIQEKIIKAIYQIHFNTLKQYEEKINKDLLTKYNLIDVDTLNMDPQLDY